MKKILFILAIALIAIVLGGNWLLQNKDETSEEKKKLPVVASFYPLAFFGSEIGGYKATVTNLTPAGTEPHDYEPSARDLANAENSRLIIINGGIENWGDKVKEDAAKRDTTVVTAAEGLMNREVEEEEGEGQTIRDPHVWLDPMLAKEEVKKITDGYIQADPQNQGYYENSESILNEKLDQLHRKYQMGLQNCQTKDFVTAHAAFGYLASRYGLNQISISGLSPEAEPSLQQVADITDFARENDIQYIFFETLVNPKLAETLANEIGAKTLVLDPLEGLSEDDINAGKNYFTVMEENLANLQTALQCTQ